MRRTISAKLTGLQILCMAVGAVICYQWIQSQGAKGYAAIFAEHGQSTAESLAKSIGSALVSHDMAFVQSELDDTLKRPDVQWAYVTGPDGEVLVHAFVPQIPDDLRASLVSGKRGRVVRLPGGKQNAIVFSSSVLTGVGGAVHVGLSQATLQFNLFAMEIGIMAALVVVFSLVAVGNAILTRRLLAPVRALTTAAQSLTEHRQNEFQPLLVRSSDELGVLTESFNRMALEIREYEAELETRVAQRTEDLSAANLALEEDIRRRRVVEEHL
jgi:methyl-accepting chemotaxis protein